MPCCSVRFWLWLVFLAGCAVPRPQQDQPWLSSPTPLPSRHPTAQPYRVGCPDVLAITIAGQADWQGVRRPIGPDGRIDLGPHGSLRVEGQTLEEAAAQVGAKLGVPSQHVKVEVADFKSQKIYIFGEVGALQRAVPYRGPETVPELLQRFGGLTAGADPNDVFVIRANVAKGGRPEVLSVNLRAIVQDRDLKTNVILEPSDQVYIGENRQSRFGKGVPPFLRPCYDKVCGWLRKGVTRPQP